MAQVELLAQPSVLQLEVVADSRQLLVALLVAALNFTRVQFVLVLHLVEFVVGVFDLVILLC